MSDPYIGEIRILPYQYCPEGWVECNGQQLAIQTNQALYGVIGALYGGDRKTYFNVPKLNGLAPVGAGQGPNLSSYVLGKMVGTQSIALTPDQMPGHSHGMTVRIGDFAAGGQTIIGPDPTGARQAPCVTRTAPTSPYGYVPDVATTTDGFLGSQTLAPTGGVSSHENRQPFLAFRFCIATDGIYPVQS